MATQQRPTVLTYTRSQVCAQRRRCLHQSGLSRSELEERAGMYQVSMEQSLLHHTIRGHEYLLEHVNVEVLWVGDQWAWRHHCADLPVTHPLFCDGFRHWANALTDALSHFVSCRMSAESTS